jgi:hypothetical protein
MKADWRCKAMLGEMFSLKSFIIIRKTVDKPLVVITSLLSPGTFERGETSFLKNRCLIIKSLWPLRGIDWQEIGGL